MGRPPKVKHDDAKSDDETAKANEVIRSDAPVAAQPVAEKKAAASVTFTGDPRGGKDPDQPEYGGKTFPKGKAVSVDDAWLKANPNIRKNSHFKVD